MIPGTELRIVYLYHQWSVLFFQNNLLINVQQNTNINSMHCKTHSCCFVYIVSFSYMSKQCLTEWCSWPSQKRCYEKATLSLLWFFHEYIRCYLTPILNESEKRGSERKEFEWLEKRRTSRKTEQIRELEQHEHSHLKKINNKHTFYLGPFRFPQRVIFHSCWRTYGGLYL